MPKLNTVKQRFLYLSPTVQAGWEDESKWEDFTTQKVLGKGAFGQVYKCLHNRSQLVYAIKVINKKLLKEHNMLDQVNNEVRIMYELNHPNILKLYNHFEDDENIYLVLEFATGGQLYQIMWKQPGKRFREKKVAQYIMQLCKALVLCHSRKIIHRDIKPENLLLDANDAIKLADFGWSNFKQNEKDVRDTYCGTLDYLPPEMYDKNRNYSFEVDVWAVGVLVYELLTGSSPFAPKDNKMNQNHVGQETEKNIQNLNYSFPKDFPIKAENMVKQILVKDIKTRYNLEQILAHPWITEHCGTQQTGQSQTLNQNFVIDKNQKPIVKAQEIDDLKTQQKVIWTDEEIFVISRPESILNKDNNFKPKQQQQQEEEQKSGQNQKDNSQFKDQMTQKIKEQELIISQLSYEKDKFKKDLEATRQELNVYKQSIQDPSTSSSDLVAQLNKEKEKYAQLKKESDFQWGKLLDYEKKVADLNNQLLEAQKSKGTGGNSSQTNIDQLLEIAKKNQPQKKHF